MFCATDERFKAGCLFFCETEISGLHGISAARLKNVFYSQKIKSAGRRRKPSTTRVISGVFLPSDVYTSTGIHGRPLLLPASRTPVEFTPPAPPPPRQGFYCPPSEAQHRCRHPQPPSQSALRPGRNKGQRPPAPFAAAARPQEAEPPPGPC